MGWGMTTLASREPLQALLWAAFILVFERTQKRSSSSLNKSVLQTREHCHSNKEDRVRLMQKAGELRSRTWKVILSCPLYRAVVQLPLHCTFCRGLWAPCQYKGASTDPAVGGRVISRRHGHLVSSHIPTGWNLAHGILVNGLQEIHHRVHSLQKIWELSFLLFLMRPCYSCITQIGRLGLVSTLNS